MNTKSQHFPPRVSIIVPTYNSEQYICDCMDSLLKQTYDHLEIIVVDDGSTDSTKDRLKRYSSVENVCVIRQENQGVSVARNRGLQLARGEYVAFVDSDDVMHPEFVASCLKLTKKDDCEFVLFDLTEFTTGESLHFTPVNCDNYTLVTTPLKYYLDMGFKGGMSAMFVQRKLLSGLTFPAGVQKGEDLCFSFSLLPRLSVGRHLHATLYFYRRIIGSLDSSEMSKKDVLAFADIMRSLHRLYSTGDAKNFRLIRRRLFPKLVKNIVKRGVRKACAEDAKEMESILSSLIKEHVFGYVGFDLRWRLYLWRISRRKRSV